MGPGTGQVAVTFRETATAIFGEGIFVVGNISSLGSWNTAKAIPLSAAEYPVWSASVGIPASTPFRYKFVRKKPDGSVVWESDPDRNDVSPASGTETLVSSWQ